MIDENMFEILKSLQDELDKTRLDLSVIQAEYKEWQVKILREEKHKKLLNTLINL